MANETSFNVNIILRFIYNIFEISTGTFYAESIRFADYLCIQIHSLLKYLIKIITYLYSFKILFVK